MNVIIGYFIIALIVFLATSFLILAFLTKLLHRIIDLLESIEKRLS